ncbi:hypothetical protein LOAG_08153 [Loa loa]|uniref:Uncharacterized protein n=1 Tax=Loa loa TaxID=7209 RepID=A0A1S0TUI3_LOALO|nr:hypothetical protein LOAG_08153 [Loa loa]EFO20334.1 hypothetical protein LOAG_08153 [Loa loa]
MTGQQLKKTQPTNRLLSDLDEDSKTDEQLAPDAIAIQQVA